LPGYIRKIALAFVASAALSGCISGIKYGDTPYANLSSDPRCNPQETSVVDVSALPLFAVTSRLPDCRSPNVILTDYRSDKIRFLRVSGQTGGDTAKGKANAYTPVAFQPETTWWSQLSKEAAQNDGRVLLYVHGFRETFESSSRDTAQIARMSGFKGPVIQYSWPSQGELLSYGVDETNMYWSERSFRSFLRQLAEQPWVKDIVLVSHSLGARLVIPALEYVDGKASSADASNISNIILASPDVDTADFERDISVDLLSARRINAGRRISIYASANDKALNLSRTFHGYPRLGSPYCFNPFEAAELKAKGLPQRCYAANLKTDEQINRPALTIIDTSDVSIGGSGHSNHLRSAAACDDFAAVINNKTGAGRTATYLPHVYALPAYPRKTKIAHDAICKRL
jgi:esterase/lipase superfamily enzyme